MSLLTIAYPRGREGSTGQGERVSWDWHWGCKWMERVKEDREGEPPETSQELQRSYQTPAPVQPQYKSWLQNLRRLLPSKDWYSFGTAGVVWSVSQVEAPLHPSVLPVDVCWRVLQVCVLWLVLGGCVHGLRHCLRLGQRKGNPTLKSQQEVVVENRQNLHAWASQSSSPGHNVPLALALADSLLMCILQEPLPDPSVPHIQALLSRLESVSHTLEKADIESEATQEEVNRDSVLKDKVMLIRTFLRQRMSSLSRLVQVQGDFEASVKDILKGLDGLWAQLEELHAGVTLTKQGSGGHRDLALAQTDAETLFTVLGHHKNRLQHCQAHLTDSTQLLQELTWSHTHISNSVSSSSSSSSSESVWPEMLLQSNIEQFDKVQESFLSLEQQTSTFQAHLEGLGKGNQDRLSGPLIHANGASSCPVSPQTSANLHSGHPSDVSPKHHNSISSSMSVSSVDADTDTDHHLSLCERSALQFSSTIGRLRKSGRRK
ncbi:uncharacterized protein si:ch211-151h10.2 [Scomber scombrus]|nr:uncharacterized protein si:ch211-151h10.2 [Scomber scombrus]